MAASVSPGRRIVILLSIGFGVLARQVMAGAWQELNLRVHDTLRAGATPGWEITLVTSQPAARLRRPSSSPNSAHAILDWR